MERKLKELFDYQRFEHNGKPDKLEKLIRETESRYGAELSDEELSMVNAAGAITFYSGAIPEKLKNSWFTGSILDNNSKSIDFK